METIELKLSRQQLEAIFYGFKALTDSMALVLAQPSSNTYIDTNTNINTLITDLASKTSLVPNTSTNTNTSKNTNTRSTSSTSNKNIIINDDDEDTVIKVNDNTCKENDIPTLEDVIEYVNTCKYRMSAKKFYDHYKNLGWKTMGGTSIVGQWRGFVDNWAKNEFPSKQQMQPLPTGKNAGMGTVEERRAAHPFVPSFDV